jgi:lipopolysaccharide transport system ATP-binding protein
MEDVSKEGRTVLFVSHNMGAIHHLCSLAILLQQGTLKAAGTTGAIIKQYLEKNAVNDFSLIEDRNGIQLKNLFIYDPEHCQETNMLTFGRTYRLHLGLRSHNAITQAVIVIKFFNSLGILVSSICSLEEGIEPFLFSENIELSFFLPQIQLFPGQYSIGVFVYRFNEVQAYFEAERILDFEVESAMVQNASWAYRQDHGVFRVSDGGNLLLNASVSRSA